VQNIEGAWVVDLDVYTAVQPGKGQAHRKFFILDLERRGNTSLVMKTDPSFIQKRFPNSESVNIRLVYIYRISITAHREVLVPFSRANHEKSL
jgi:hypothetical protein